MDLNNLLAGHIAHALQRLYGVCIAPEQITLQATRPEFKGHLTLVTFPFLRDSKKSPEATSQEIGEALLLDAPEVFQEIQVVKGFLNLTIAPSVWKELLCSIVATENYGHRTVTEQSPLVMVEYSSPNTNKPLHLGHVRNNLLGFSLSKILEANGYRVVKTNIVNDRGIHICKSMLAWQKWGNGVTPELAEKKGDHLVGDFYVLFDKHYKAEVAALEEGGLSRQEAEEQSPLMKEARAMLRAWEQGDPKVVSLWRQMNAWVYDGFDETYQRMGVGFDKIYYESDTYLIGKEEVLRGLQENLFIRHEDGSVWADLRSEGLDEKILLRSDGTSVYMTQDIGTAKMRYGDFPIDKMIYVVGNEQEYHFKVLSLLLDRLGFSFGKDLTHFSYGMVELPEGKMKSREGTVVDADDLMDEMVSTAYRIAQEAREQKGGEALPEEEARETARRVGLGALKYFILKVDPRKNMTFNPKESIDFNGNTGAFVQYTYARICSLLDKAHYFDAGVIIPLTETQSVLNEYEIALVGKLSEYPSVVAEAGKSYSPALLANYVYDLVKEYNQFYHECPVMKVQDEDLRATRLHISAAIAQIVERCMGLLGIEMPRRM